MSTPEFFMNFKPSLPEMRSYETLQAPGVDVLGHAAGAVVPSAESGIRYDIASTGVTITQVQSSFSGLPYVGSSIVDNIALACHSVSTAFSNPDREPPITPETVKAGMFADVKGLACSVQSGPDAVPLQTPSVVDPSKSNGIG